MGAYCVNLFVSHNFCVCEIESWLKHEDQVKVVEVWPVI